MYCTKYFRILTWLLLLVTMKANGKAMPSLGMTIGDTHLTVQDSPSFESPDQQIPQDIQRILHRLLRINIDDRSSSETEAKWARTMPVQDPINLGSPSKGKTRSRLQEFLLQTRQFVSQAESLTQQTQSLLKISKNLADEAYDLVNQLEDPAIEGPITEDLAVTANDIVLRAEDLSSSHEMVPHIPLEEVSGLESRGRHKRAADAPRIADILRKAMKSPGLNGDVVFSARRFSRMYFGFDFTTLNQYEEYKGALYLYKLSKRKRKNPRKKTQSDDVRVSVYQILDPSKNQHSSIRLLESRLVSAFSKGWVKFDITAAIKEWTRNLKSNFGLEVWIESANPSRYSVRLARKTKFVLPNKGKLKKQPQLVISLLDKKEKANHQS